MTRLEALRRTVISCDKYFEEQLTAAEILLVDLGGTAQEVTAALGPNGFARLMLQRIAISRSPRWRSARDRRRHTALRP
jgi:hypothetical protein